MRQRRKSRCRCLISDMPARTASLGVQLPQVVKVARQHGIIGPVPTTTPRREIHKNICRDIKHDIDSTPTQSRAGSCTTQSCSRWEASTCAPSTTKSARHGSKLPPLGELLPPIATAARCRTRISPLPSESNAAAQSSKIHSALAMMIGSVVSEIMQPRHAAASSMRMP